LIQAQLFFREIIIFPNQGAKNAVQGIQCSKCPVTQWHF